MDTRHSRRRRRVESTTWTRRRVCWCVTGLLLLTGDASAGRSELSWSIDEKEGDLGPTAMAMDASGALVVSECSVGGETFDIAKFSGRGDPLWRQTIRADDVVGEGGGTSTACPTAIAIDAALNLYVTGTITRENEDLDVFVARLSPSTRSVAWTKTLGTSFADVVTCLSIDDEATSLVMGGYSAGRLTLGRASPSNCGEWSNEPGSCDDGFVVRIGAADGTIQWIQTVASEFEGETRVFDVVVSNNASLVMVVGETRGRLSLNTTSNHDGRHAGDVFIRRLALDSGASLWTTQLTSAGDFAESCQQPLDSSQYTRVYPRGRCGLTMHSTQLSVVGTTQGLLSSVPSQRNLYHDVCRASACMQAFLARLDIVTGAVRWIQQLVHIAHTTAERVVALPDSDAVVLATADAGFFTTAESMEQLAMFRASHVDGGIKWTTQLGLTGEDHAVAAITQDSANPSVAVLAHGSTDNSRRGRISTQSWIRRVHAEDGAAVPVCVDVVGFDTLRGSQVNATHSNEWYLVQLSLRRANSSRCMGATATVRYHYTYSIETNVSASTTSSTSGVVQFTTTQSTPSLALVVPGTAAEIRVLLEEAVDDTAVDGASSEWTQSLVRTADEEEDASSGGAADGRLWQQLTWITLVVAVIATGLVVVGGRVVCWRSSLWSWRRAKAFQYSTLRLRRSRLASHARDHDSAAEETDELRSHLEEIQHLNDSLDGLLVATQATAASPRSPALVAPTSRPRATSSTSSSGWKRSLRRLLPSSPKKRDTNRKANDL